MDRNKFFLLREKTYGIKVWVWLDQMNKIKKIPDVFGGKAMCFITHPVAISLKRLPAGKFEDMIININTAIMVLRQKMLRKVVCFIHNTTIRVRIYSKNACSE